MGGLYRFVVQERWQVQSSQDYRLNANLFQWLPLQWKTRGPRVRPSLERHRWRALTWAESRCRTSKTELQSPNRLWQHWIFLHGLQRFNRAIRLRESFKNQSNAGCWSLSPLRPCQRKSPWRLGQLIVWGNQWLEKNLELASKLLAEPIIWIE